MASTYSTLKVELIGTGEQTGTWGTTTNDNLSVALGEAITGSADVAFSSADVTVTLTDTNGAQTARNLRLNLTGTSGGARNLILGSGCQIEKLYLINNGLADAVTVKNTSGTGIAVAAGKTMFVYNNGTNVVEAITQFNGTIALASGVSGILPIANGGTGTSSTTFANLATNVTGTLPIANGGTGTTSTTFANLATNVTGTLPVANGGTGQTTYTNGQLLIGNTTGNTLTKATLTEGTGITITNGTGTITIAASGGSEAQGGRGQVFTTSGTFTIPTGVTAIKATIVGGGGTGGNANATGTGTGAGGGGGGGVAYKFLTSLTPGNTISVTVGGAAGSSSIASGTQSITTVTASGGASTANTSSTNSGGAGGTTTNADLGITGGVGGNGASDNGCGCNRRGLGGGGGAAGGSAGINGTLLGTNAFDIQIGGGGPWGAGGKGGANGGNASAGRGYGSGGGGGGSSGGGSNGSAGLSGVVIIEF